MTKILGTSYAMQKLRHTIERFAKSSSRVLILGENGTGKELVARALHEASPRKDKLFVSLNCAAIPHNLIESQLFGHEKGSFTGAMTSHTGLFEHANDGTLFLDEIGDLNLELQAKLLRVLQSREFTRVGGNKVHTTSARVIAATNRDLLDAVRQHRFRQDLYHRLSVLVVQTPSLSEHREDIAELAQQFLANEQLAAGIHPIEHIVTSFESPQWSWPTSFTPEALDALGRADWPGNVRELENVVARAYALVEGSTIDANLVQEAIDMGKGYQQRAQPVGDVEHLCAELRAMREDFAPIRDYFLR